MVFDCGRREMHFPFTSEIDGQRKAAWKLWRGREMRIGAGKGTANGMTKERKSKQLQLHRERAASAATKTDRRNKNSLSTSFILIHSSVCVRVSIITMEYKNQWKVFLIKISFNYGFCMKRRRRARAHSAHRLRGSIRLPTEDQSAATAAHLSARRSQLRSN